MSKRINLILVLSGFILFLSGCGTTFIPANYRHTPGGAKRAITGSWTEVKLKHTDITESETSLSGELIAIQSDTMYILTAMGLKDINTSNIAVADLYLFVNQAEKNATITGLLYIPDILAAIIIGEPAFLLLGVPWIITGTIISVVEGSAHLNKLNYPGKNQLSELKKFARFPQGLPSDIDKSRFHLITGR